MPKEPLSKVIRRRTNGVLFLIIVAALIALSIAIYAKVFVSTVDVTLKIDSTGNQLQEASDVKENGLIVGEVDSISSNGDIATVSLHLDPDMVDQIPNNVTAQILPKTLFGEQYVNLIRHDGATGDVRDGETIYGVCDNPDETCSASQRQGVLEAQTVLGNLLPLLVAVQPAQLNSTLTALATALDGRGNELGKTIVNFDNYLKIMNSTSPTGNTYVAQLTDDLDKLGKVATEYNGVSPDLFASLRNLLVSSRTLIEKRANFDRLLSTGTSASGVLGQFLTENEDRIIVSSGQTQKIFGVLNTYTPEYSCLFAGINELYTKAGTAIYDGAIHLSASPDTTNLGPYVNGNQPKYVKGFGPNCFGLPNNPTPVDAKGRFQIPEKFQCVNDGAALTARGESPNCKTNTSSQSADLAGSPAERALLNAMLATKLHTTPDKVSSEASMLAGPLYRGQDVVIK